MRIGNAGMEKISSDLRGQLVELASPEGWLYAGLPKFRRLFGRDSIIAARQMMYSDPEIAKHTLLKLCTLQGKSYVAETGEENGKIPHEHLGDNVKGLEQHLKRVPWLKAGSTNYFSVDSTPMFLMLADQYFRKTGDKDFISGILEHIKNAVDWMINDGIFNNMLVYHKSRQGLGLQSQSWRDGIGSILDSAKDPVAVVGVQGYFIEALDSAIHMVKHFDFALDAENLAELRNDAIEAVENYFYLDETGYFALAVDGDGVAVTNVTSDPGHLLHSMSLSTSSTNKIISRLMEPDLMTPYGIRSMSSEDPQFDSRAYHRGSIWPHDNWLIAEGMKKTGHLNEYNRIRDAMLASYEELGSIPEYYGVDRKGKLIPIERLRVKPCDPQAWSTCALLNFIGQGPDTDRKEGD